MNNEEIKIKEKIELAKEITELIANHDDSLDYNYFPLLGAELTDKDSKIAHKFSDEAYMKSIFNQFNNVSKTNKGRDIVNKIELYERKRKNRLFVINILSIASALIAASLLIYYNTDGYDYSIESTSINEHVNYRTPTLLTSYGNIELNSKQIDSSMVADNTFKMINNNKISYVKNSNNALNNATDFNHLIVPAKHNYSVVLSDKSEVTLNSKSSLKYPSHFGTEERIVEVTGEAYFNIAKSDKPFIVKYNNIYVKVYGTQFNVNTHNTEKLVVTLVEGKVGIGTNNTENSETVIEPNQQLSINVKNNKVTVREVNASNYIISMHDANRYNGVELEYIINSLEAWYDVKIKYNSEDVINKSVTAILKKDRSIESVFKLLENILDINFIKIGKGSYELKRK